MPGAASLAAIAAAALLSAWGARRDLHVPLWLTLTAFACASVAATLAFGAEHAAVAALVLTCLLIVETDRRLQLIPDAFTLALLTLSFVLPFSGDLATRALGAAALGGTFFVVRQVCALRGRADALGWGDIKLAGAMGAALGPVNGFAAVAIAGAATLLVLLVRARTSGAAALGAPFGIGLAAATAALSIASVLAP